MSAERLAAHGLLDSIERTTPGGITREQFRRRGIAWHVGLWAARIGFAAVLVASALTYVTR